MLRLWKLATLPLQLKCCLCTTHTTLRNQVRPALEYFESRVNPSGDDIHKLEVRAEVSRDVLKRMSAGIKAKAQASGGDLTGSPAELKELVEYIDGIADSFVDDMFPPGVWDPTMRGKGCFSNAVADES